ncbi:MAG TPA: lipoate protein ligase C-terminal domain-containing protein [Candidatus Nanoarchaeia archaeon]|nr:lipoate protein ligase C-terminal domain-containing protein [Candidatus Nanoarchaeia archaeon]
MHTITEKVPGGKLVRLKIDTELGVIRKMQIAGDFFLHPEETIDDIERALVGITVEQDVWVVAAIITSVLEQKNAQFIGVTAGDLARLIMQAVKQ